MEAKTITGTYQGKPFTTTMFPDDKFIRIRLKFEKFTRTVSLDDADLEIDQED